MMFIVLLGGHQLQSEHLKALERKDTIASKMQGLAMETKICAPRREVIEFGSQQKMFTKIFLTFWEVNWINIEFTWISM